MKSNFPPENVIIEDICKLISVYDISQNILLYRIVKTQIQIFLEIAPFKIIIAQNLEDNYSLSKNYLYFINRIADMSIEYIKTVNLTLKL